MKVIIAPDKFKGSLTSFQACEAIAAGIRSTGRDIETHLFPMADGGDGFAAIMKHYRHTETVECMTVDPLGRPIRASYELDRGADRGQSETMTAIIEMASASGMVLLREEERDPEKASTYGTGLLIRDAIEKGAGRIILGLGGSATNDAGTGILSALGFVFKDNHGSGLTPCGGNLLLMAEIVPPDGLSGPEFEVACDVQNILYGEQGAAYVYAPQKGATSDQVKLLDAGLAQFARVILHETGRDIAGIPGTGAAGGIAAGLMGFFKVRIRKGIMMVMEAAAISQAIPGADLVVTGEGKIDNQTADGKVVSALAALAHEHHIPAIAFCGRWELDSSGAKNLQLQSVQVITPPAMNIGEAMANADRLLREKVREYFTRAAPFK